MVLINGVKYACERCIRGHRVTTCTHTDQQLTMIKPKGRPATQCQHCREQRKLKHSHVSCTCGAKGKAPGTHLALCLCHKNSHCTCSSAASRKIAGDKNKKKALTKATLHNGSQPPVSLNGVSSGETGTITPSNGSDSSLTKKNQLDPYVIEDVMVPFEAGHGLFDLFLPNSEVSGGLSLNVNLTSPSFTAKPNYNDNDSNDFKSVAPAKSEEPRPLVSDSDEVDLVENMFPLFPLVGSCSFDDSKSLPMLSIPRSPQQEEKRHTYQPRPHKPSSHALASSQSRPKRPESSLSITSNSSGMSMMPSSDPKPNHSFTLPTQLSSSAFPPFELAEEDSPNEKHNFYQQQPPQEQAKVNDTTSTNSILDNNVDVFNDAYDLRLMSYEDFIKNLNTKATDPNIPSPASVTPQSSVPPSRQPLQLRYQRSDPTQTIPPTKYDEQFSQERLLAGLPDEQTYNDFAVPMFNEFMGPVKIEDDSYNIQ